MPDVSDCRAAILSYPFPFRGGISARASCSAHSRGSGNPVLSFVRQSLDPRVRGDERRMWSAPRRRTDLNVKQPRKIARILCGPG